METITEESILINKKIKVEPIIRPGKSWLGTGHDGEFMYTGSIRQYDLPIDKNTTQFKQILNKEEQEFFEKKLQLKPGALSFYDKENKFWSELKIKVSKEGIKLDLSEPMDFLRWKVLLANVKEIAPSQNEKFDKNTYMFMLVDENYQVEERATKANKTKAAYKAYGNLTSSESKMRNFLRVWGKKPSNGATREFMEAEIDKIIEQSLDEFLAIIKDSNYEHRLFIEDALEAKALTKVGRTAYALPGGDKIGGSLQEAIDWIKDPKNSEEVLTIKVRIEANN